ncbi:MAG TPA: YciI family protein [Actinophytocola sp.]|uniref:YciI family protein n=1 Tax=Actinophytocola sp. TaxID=1872138 RepID=UPI002DDDA193|nr:YciI family protein [Actinophytocola sp.]HEV2781096.1 YciI family protein [Actinophytocola sp.]
MKYVLMLCSDVAYRTDLERAAAETGPACATWGEEVARRGAMLSSAGLRPATDATTVRVRNGEVLLTDGPFAETKDQIGGFSVIEAADLDEALELAAKHPWAAVGQIEVRPVWEP